MRGGLSVLLGAAAVAGLAGCIRLGFGELDALGGDADADAVGGPWHDLGGSASGAGVSNRPWPTSTLRIDVAADGRVYVGWTDSHDGDPEIYLAVWDGAAWGELGGSASGGGISNLAGESRFGSLKVDAQGLPNVAWMQTEGGGRDVYYARWTGTQWAGHAGSEVSGVGSLGEPWWPNLTFGAAGQPLLAAEAYGLGADGLGVILVGGWDGSAWDGILGTDDYPGVSGGAGQAMEAQLAFAGGQLWAAWSEDRGGARQVYARRYDGLAWQSIAGSADGRGVSDTDDSSTRPSLAVDGGGLPSIAWEVAGPNGPYVGLATLRGGVWVGLGNSRDAPGLSGRIPSLTPSLTLDGDLPVVAYEHDDGANYEIYLSRWDGAAWQELGGTGGVSQSPRPSHWPHAAAGADGTIYVAWEEDLGVDQPALYVRAW